MDKDRVEIDKDRVGIDKDRFGMDETGSQWTKIKTGSEWTSVVSERRCGDQLDHGKAALMEALTGCLDGGLCNAALMEAATEWSWTEPRYPSGRRHATELTSMSVSVIQL